MTDPPRKRPGIRGVVGTLALLVVVATCVRLGFWQLDRLAQRRALNARVAARQLAPPLTGPAALADTATALYRTIELSGRFDDGRSVVLPGRALRGVPGVHLLTPLLVAPETAILVNRGWLPSADGATVNWDSVPPASAAGNAATVTGLVLPFPPGRRQTAPGAGERGFRRVWYRLDEDALRGQYPYQLLPALVQLLPSPAAPRRPAALEPPALDNGPHLSYALQWFSFATIAVIGWIALVLRSRRDRQPGRPGLTVPPPAE